MENEIKITLPLIKDVNKKVGGNSIVRILLPSITINVKFTSKQDDIFKYFTNLEHPLDYIYITTKKKKPDELSDCFLLHINKSDMSEIDEETELSWIDFPLIHKDSSNLSDWTNKFIFKNEDKTSDVKGLRKPQIGALHAVSAYLYGEKPFSPATVVLPTGTGKTETMLSLFFYHKLDKLLILVPSNALRKQLSNKFITLGCLPEFGITPTLSPYPKVAIITAGIKQREAKEIIINSNVIIATPNILNASNQSEAKILFDGCNALFVDEAHHISAHSWDNVRQNFLEKPVVQFTATPFRNDGKNLGGKIIYNYTLGSAQKDGYFKKISLSTVEEYIEADKDASIASKAIAILRKDLDDGYDHLLMARVSTQLRAEEIFNTYRDVARDLNPVIIHSGLSQRDIRDRLERLIERKAKIAICVDMLGEGFDLPNLKIAAIHDHHKSLAITLQFIGRFTRISHKFKIGDASVIVNIADPNVEKELQNLYSQDSNWDQILKRLSEETISKEIRLQELVESLKSKGDLYKQISLWNLRPSFSVMLFKANCKEWNPELVLNILPKLEQSWHSISEDRRILMVLGVRTSPIRWGNFKDVNDINHLILIIYYNEDSGNLSVYSNDYLFFRIEKLIENLTNSTSEQVSGTRVFQVLNNVQYPLVLNLGSSTTGAISFTQFFGPNVSDGLTDIEKKSATLSNIAIMGYEDGNKILWGCSQRKGKIWSPKAGSILEWKEWVDSTWSKINEEDLDEHNITREFLRPVKIKSTYEENPVSIQWGEYLQTRFEENVTLSFGKDNFNLYDIDLKVSKENGYINTHIISPKNHTIYKIDISEEHTGGYDYELLSGEEIKFTIGSNRELYFRELMYQDPIVIHYIDGSFTYNCYLVKVSNEINFFDSSDLISYNWGSNLTKESMGKERNKNTVQHKTFTIIKDSYDIIINDDESGEAADLVCIKEYDDHILLSLYHCKFSATEKPGARLQDLYEVCGQAQRSIRWKHTGMNFLFKHIKKREEKWRRYGYSRFLVGDMPKIQYIRELSRTKPLKFKVTIVQPGIKKETISDEMLRLLGSTKTFIKKTTMAELIVLSSD